MPKTQKDSGHHHGARCQNRLSNKNRNSRHNLSFHHNLFIIHQHADSRLFQPETGLNAFPQQDVEPDIAAFVRPRIEAAPDIHRFQHGNLRHQ